jgi:hypothetical protein
LKGVQFKKAALPMSTDLKQHLEACFMADTLTARFYPTIEGAQGSTT